MTMTDQGGAPLVVVVGEEAQLAAACAAVEPDGWERGPLDARAAGPGLMQIGMLRDSVDAARAVLAAARGAGVVVGVAQEGQLLELVVGDLRTLGPVEV